MRQKTGADHGPENSSFECARKRGRITTEMKRLKQLEDENGRLKRIVADLSLDKEMLQDVIRRKL